MPDSRAVVEIVGAGRDATSLHARDDDVVAVQGAGDLAGLIVRDLTFDGDFLNVNQAGDFLDVRGCAAAIFERVDFRNWS